MVGADLGDQMMEAGGGAGRRWRVGVRFAEKYG